MCAEIQHNLFECLCNDTLEHVQGASLILRVGFHHSLINYVDLRIWNGWRLLNGLLYWALLQKLILHHCPVFLKLSCTVGRTE